MLDEALAARPRARLATLATPLEPGPVLPGGARLWVKRDDLTGLGLGGNKARKLELLCGQALADGADTLVTVGAAQSNHCRMTAAAGAVLGLPVHLVLGGSPPGSLAGNQLLSALFGATSHFPGTDDWNTLEAAADDLAARLRAEGFRPAVVPIGGSTAVGAAGFVAAAAELAGQCERLGLAPVAIVHATSSGGTHAGLVAGRAALRAEGRVLPTVHAVDVARSGRTSSRAVLALAAATLDLLGLDPCLATVDDVEVDDRWCGPGYAVPTEAGDDAVRWAAARGGWVLDRTYTGKAFAGLLGRAVEGRYPAGADVVFWHTGGHPAVFAPHGAPLG